MLVPLAFVVGTLSEDATPSIAGIEKMDFGWIGTAVMLSLILFMIAVSLIPPVSGTNRYGADPRLDEPEYDGLAEGA